MNKSILHGLIVVLLFFSTWFILSRIDWVSVFKVEEATDKTEQELGKLFWEELQNSGRENKNAVVTSAIDSIVTHICEANEIDRKSVKVHVLNTDEINAFAMPDGHLVVCSGLIENTNNQEELTGIICHEIAHIELNHVMKKLVKEIGLSVLLSTTTGNAGGEATKGIVKSLSSSAFDRSLEKEADLKAVDYLTAAKVNPGPFADFLYLHGENEPEFAKYLTWISTHPDSKERAKYIVDHIPDESVEYSPILSTNTWDHLREELATEEEDFWLP